MVRRRIVALLGALAGAFASLAHAFSAGEPYFETVGDGTSIPEGVVTALAQDRAGFLWIGTADGLIRYDGYRFIRFARDARDPNSLYGDFVLALQPAADGRLWIATYAHGAGVFDPATGRMQRFRHAADDPASLAHDTVRAFAEDAHGIWFGTRRGLDYLRNGTTGFVHFRHGGAGSIGDDDVSALLVDRAGDVWVGSAAGLDRRRAGTDAFERVLSAPGEPLAGAIVSSLFEAQDGRVWVLSRQGDGWILDPRVAGFAPVAMPAGDHGDVRGVAGFVQPSEREVWMARSGGIDVTDAATGAIVRRIGHDPAIPSSLASNDVRTLLRDRSGQLWVGVYGAGLQRHDPRDPGRRVIRHSPTRPDTPSDPSIISVLERSDGTVWLGTRNHGIDVLDRERGVVGGHRPSRAPGALGAGWVTALVEDAGGTVWVGTPRGVYRYDATTHLFRAYVDEPALAGQAVRRLLVDRTGALWIGTTSGVSRLAAPDAHVEAVPGPDGDILRADVNALVEDRDGVVWVGAATGLFTVEPGADVAVPIDDGPRASGGLTHSSVVGLLVDRDGVLWVDTADGLHRLRSRDGARAAFDALSARHGYGGRPFGANLLQDDTGRIWTHKFLYDPAADTLRELAPVDLGDIGTGWFRSYARTRDGLLMFGGSKGLLVVEPARWKPWDYAPPVVATELKVDGATQPVRRFEEVRLAPRQKGFSLEFAALDYTAADRVRYAYRLEGYDDDWIETDATHRVASYGNLWPGEYVLHVRGSTHAGSWSPHELTLPVHVEPLVWQTPWFAALVVLALSGAVYAGHRGRVALLRARTLELRDLVAQRTAELSTANTRLLGSNAELSAANQRLVETREQLVMQEKMASLGALVAGVAHEINTPLGVAVTASSLLSERTRDLRARAERGDLRRSEVDEYVALASDSTAMVDANLARAAHLVRTFRQVSADRNLDERRTFDLAGYLHDVLATLEPTWRARSVAFELDCPARLELDSHPGALAQIVGHLVQNALQHAFEGDERGTLRLVASADGPDHVSIVFSDDGRGIDAAHLPHVFDPFFTTKRARGLTGLGLHIVYNLAVARLGGHVDVASTPGRGATFTLRVPRTVAAGVTTGAT